MTETDVSVTETDVSVRDRASTAYLTAHRGTKCGCLSRMAALTTALSSAVEVAQKKE